jgi:hypothetical protein
MKKVDEMHKILVENGFVKTLQKVCSWVEFHDKEHEKSRLNWRTTMLLLIPSVVALGIAIFKK